MSESDRRSTQRESLFFAVGKRIGYWYAANRSEVNRNVKRAVLVRLPGGRFLSRFL